ncbi:uncharacterized protein LOC127279444 [Leptopilina boulardi]|uniref:uncharacterized protein LOC127279444 n=1 Tax=Leptopilina boulardi TaxID=63433 RepID=UPI0021F64ABF|nr:uncharacterized protein LOC127279444 [Leptopilina boulardi]XP_051157749.1 uncharacterized protein LOC127279444 [Leptopilina boulardi]
MFNFNLNEFMNQAQAEAFSGDKDSFFKCFYPNKCHVCHRLDNKENPLKRCSSCQLMTYCGREHQVKDWKMHKDFCKILKEYNGPEMFNSLKELQDPVNASNDMKFRLLRQRVMQKKLIFGQLVNKLNRPPFLYEMEMILYPRICSVCYENNQSLLTSCFNCPQVSFCKKHKNDSSHLKICHLFKRACEMNVSDPHLSVFFQMEVKQFKTVTLYSQKSGTCLPNSMEDFLSNNSCIKVKRNSKQETIIPNNIWEIYLSDALCPPLTILYALEKLKFSISTNLTIHVIGATNDEIEKPIWELILHWLPEVINLNITFIGPQIEGRSNKIRKDILCESCIKKGVHMDFEFSTEFYQNFMKSSSFVKPNFIVAYNAGLHAYPTWYQAIKLVVGLHCPFIQTSFTEIEADQDHKMIKSIVPGVKHFYFGLNPFASYQCERNSDDEQIFARSEILTIYDYK